MSDNNKLTSEKLKQLQQLQQMMVQKQKGDNTKTPAGLPPGDVPKTAKILRKLTPKGIIMTVLQGMQNSVKFIDQFTKFIIKKDSDKINDVIQSARAPIMFGIFVLVFFVFIGLFWSAAVPLDSAAVAIGAVISDSNKKISTTRNVVLLRKSTSS